MSLQIQPLQFNPISWSDRQSAIGLTHAEWGCGGTIMPLGRACSLPSIPSINHNYTPSLPQIPAIHNSTIELDKRINKTTKDIEEQAKRFLEEQSKQTEKLKEHNKKNELRNELLRTKKQDMIREIAELQKRQNEKDKMLQEIEDLKRERKEIDKKLQEIKDFKREELCKKLDNTMDYCITRRGHQGGDIDSDWVCIGTTYVLKKIDGYE